jgi:ferric-dicitrate binding protein FerR (iron transport regulator)
MKIDDNFIIRFLNGELSEEDKKSLEEEDMRLTERQWKKLAKRIDRYDDGIRNKNIIASAFIIIIFLFAGFMFLRYKPEKGENDIDEIIDVFSAEGAISKLILPDSSIVFLNSSSHLRYARNFIQAERTVYLNGEAYFMVSHIDGRPFDVIADSTLKVTALGTEFNVSSYEEDDSVKVTLTEGSVKLSLGSKSYSMQPGQVASLGKTMDGDINIRNTNVLWNTAWKEGKIIFRNTKFKDIASTLSRHFNADIEIKGLELENYEYSATFKDESLEEILYLFKMTAPINYRIVGSRKNQDGTFTKKKVFISLKK